MWVTCVIIGSGNGMSIRHSHDLDQFNLLWIGLLGINFSEIWIKIYKNEYKKVNLKLFAEWRAFYLGPGVLTHDMLPVETKLDVLRFCSITSPSLCCLSLGRRKGFSNCVATQPPSPWQSCSSCRKGADFLSHRTTVRYSQPNNRYCLKQLRVKSVSHQCEISL